MSDNVSWTKEPDSWQMQLVKDANSRVIAKLDAMEEPTDIKKQSMFTILSKEQVEKGRCMAYNYVV